MAKENETRTEDEWRYHHFAQTTQPAGYVFVSETITHADAEFNIRAPSTPALFLSAAVKARNLAAPCLQDLGRVEHPELFDCLESLAATVVFSLTALEAFANEQLPSTLSFVWRRNRQEEVLDRDGVERRLDLGEKLDQILPGICGVKSPKGTKVWEDFVWLKQFRNDLIHFKGYPTGRGYQAPEKKYVWQELLSERVRRAPEIAFGVIKHFMPWKAVPSWVAACPLNQSVVNK